MVNRLLHLFLIFLMPAFGWAQVDNFKWINIQGQLMNSTETSTSFEFLVLSLDADTLYREQHNLVPLTADGAFTLAFGNGSFIGGSFSDLSEIDWTMVERVDLYHAGDSRYLQASYSLFAVPYAFHSLRLSNVPSVTDLLDVVSGELSEDIYLKFDGTDYYFSTYVIGDSMLFAYVSNETKFSDTAWFAFGHDFADSALYAYYSDSANFALAVNSTLLSDTSLYVDSAGIALNSPGNWSIFGNVMAVDTNFIGSFLEEDFVVRTNSNRRLVLGTSYETHNNFPGSGFRMNVAKRGALFTPNLNPGVSIIDGPYMYFDGATYSFHGGSSLGEIDTLKGIYSFAFCENVGTNGMYSSVFGKDTYGDTAYFSGTTPYSAISSFALGRNCRVAHMGVAIGDSAIANYYRNIAIGRNVVANTQSSGIAMGSNVIVRGATSWAVGHNLTANGHFATVLGTNASTLALKGGFLYGDVSTTDTVVHLVDNQFMARAAGGVIFYSSGDLTMGVELLPGAGSWSMISDRSKKRNIVELNPLNFAAQFDSLTVFGWNYIGQSTLHIGPMAQDFYHLFEVGEKEYYINMIDADGVTFLGIKYLDATLKQGPASEEVEELQEQLRKEQEAQAEMERRIKELYEKVATH